MSASGGDHRRIARAAEKTTAIATAMKAATGAPSTLIVPVCATMSSTGSTSAKNTAAIATSTTI